MLNGGALNSSALNAGRQTLRVVLAAAIFSCSATGVADARLAEQGQANLHCRATMVVEGVRWPSYAPMRGGADLAVTPTRTTYPALTLAAQADLAPEPWRVQFGKALGAATAGLVVEHLVSRHGIAELSVAGTLRAIAHLDGVQEADADFSAQASLEALPTRFRPGQVVFSSHALFGGEGPLPGRGSAAYGEASADLQVLYHAFLPTSAGLHASAEMTAVGRLAEQAALTFAAGGSLAVEYRMGDQADAALSAGAAMALAPTRTAYFESSITGGAELIPTETRTAYPQAELTGEAELTPNALRTAHLSANLEGVASFAPTATVGQEQLGETATTATAHLLAKGFAIHQSNSVLIGTATISAAGLLNIHNPAPHERTLLVPDEPRTFIVPYVNRTMTVT